MKNHTFPSDCGILCQTAYRLSTVADKQAKCQINTSPHPKCHKMTQKQTYTITKKSSLSFGVQSRRYIYQKLCYLQIKQQYIPTLCRIYGIRHTKLQTLFEKQAHAFRLLQKIFPKENDIAMTNALSNACKDLKMLALDFSNSRPHLPLHRQLMLKDIADEFILCAHTLSEISAVILMEQTRHKKKV